MIPIERTPRNGGEFSIGPQRLAAYAWPGGYPIIYVIDEHLQVCPKCANSGEFTTAAEHPDWGQMQVITSAHVNYEDENELCSECNEPLESAYGAGDEPESWRAHN